MKTFKKLSTSVIDPKFYNGYDKNYSTINLPQGFEKFTLDGETPRKARLNILPYTIDTITPSIKKLEKDDIGKGDLHYEASYWAHRSVGVNNSTVVCPLETIGKPCPICEYRNIIRRQGADKEVYKQFFAQHRQLWALEAEGAEKNPYIWDVSNFVFGKRLMEYLNMMQEDNPDVLYFADPVRGASVMINIDKGSFTKPGGGTINDVKSLTLVPRKVPVSEANVDAVPDLNSLFIVKTYEELREMFQHTDHSDDSEEAPYTVAGTESNVNAGTEDEVPFEVVEKVEVVEDTPVEESVLRCPHGFGFGHFDHKQELCMACDIDIECNKARKG